VGVEKDGAGFLEGYAMLLEVRAAFGQLSAFLGIALREGQTSARVTNTAEIVFERHAAAVSAVLNSPTRVRQS
jgi:hypothetical protein